MLHANNARRKKQKSAVLVAAASKPHPQTDVVMRVFEMPELVHKILMLSQAYKPVMLLGLTCKVIHRVIDAEVWANMDMIQVMLRRWHPPGVRHLTRFSEGALPDIRKVENIAFSYAGDDARVLLDERFLPLINARHIPRPLKQPFIRFAKRVLYLESITRCGMCGSRGTGSTFCFWLLGKRVCAECRGCHFMSQQRLYDVYGLRLHTRFQGKMLMEHMLGKVFIAYFPKISIEQLRLFSHHADDIKGFMPNAQNLFVWLPQLADILDLQGLKDWQLEKKQAMEALVHLFKAASVRHLVLVAQDEAQAYKKHKRPVAFTTMEAAQKAEFIERLREAKAVMLSPKKKTPRGQRHRTGAYFGPHYYQLNGWLLLNQRGSLRNSL